MDWSSPDVKLSTDACLTGAGGWCGNMFFSCAFPKAVLVKDFHINVLELLTILVALRLWGDKFSGSRLQLYCDNDASVVIINSGKTRDKEMLRILREILFIGATHGFQIRAVHLPGVVNRKADFLSRAASNPSIRITEVMDSDSVRCEVHDSDFLVIDHW